MGNEMKPKLWTKDYLVTAGINVLIMFIYYQIMVIIALFSMDHLDATPSEAGFAAGILIVAALSARILTGMAVDRQGHRKMLFIGIIINSLAMGLYYIVPDIPILIAVRLLHGVGFGMATTATITSVAHLVPESRRGEGIGYFMLSVTLASAIGPSLGIYLYQQVNFTAILLLNSVLLAFILLLAMTLRVPRIAVHQEARNGSGFTFHDVFEVKVIPLSLVGFLIFFGYSSIIGFFSVYVQVIELVGAGALYFIIQSLATLVTRPFVGKLFDEKGENFVIYPSFIIFTGGLFVISNAHAGWTLLAAAALLGAGFGTFVPSMQTVAINKVETHRMSLATTTNLAISEIGIGIGPFILGLLIPGIGFRGIYRLLALVALGGMILYYFVHGRSAAKRKA